MSLNSVPTRRPVTILGQNVPNAAHICAFFDSRAQELDCMPPYFAEGLTQGEQVVTIRDAEECASHASDLQKRMAHPLDAAVHRNQLRIVASEETYLKDGAFQAERMYEMLKQLLEEAEAQRFKRVRTCGEMSWALRDMPGTDELMEYESMVNDLTAKHDCTLMCVYDVNRFSGRAVMDVFNTHPMVVMGGRIYENPYYVPPQQYLETLVRRGVHSLAREEA